MVVVSLTVVVSTITGVTVVVSTFVGWAIVVSTVPEAESVLVTGSLEIGMRVDERVVFAGHFAVGFAPARHTLLVLFDVLCAVAEDDITTIVNATATIAYRPLFRVFILPSICYGSFVLRRPKRRRRRGGGRQATCHLMCHGSTRWCH
jgi:hypothetical protein